MKDKALCVVIDQNGSYFSDCRAKGNVFKYCEKSFEVRGTFTSDIYFSNIMWYALPTKGIMKNSDVIIGYIEKGKHCVYRFRLGKKHAARVKQILSDNHIQDRTGTVKEW